MSHIGIDFGTSNCLASRCVETQIMPFRLTDSEQVMPTAMYVLKTLIDDVSMDDPAVRQELTKREGVFKRQQTRQLNQAKRDGEQLSQRVFSDREIKRLVELAYHRERQQLALEKTRLMPLLEALERGSEVVFGDLAIETSLVEGNGGFLVKSPKSFLGAKLRKDQLATFRAVCARFLSHIRSTCEEQANEILTQVVIGRPVNFHGAQGEAGNCQAVGILKDAAHEAGFKDVSFLLEPVAAAIDFERTLERDLMVLVVDLGGGTTDCTMMPLGPTYRRATEVERLASVLAHSGDRMGGLDLDIRLSHHLLMPAFGKGTSTLDRMPMPAHFFWDGCAVNDLELQRRFINEDLAYYASRAAEPAKLERLLELQQRKAMPRLQMTAEVAKIWLSNQEHVLADLSYVEPDFNIAVSRADYEAAIEKPLHKFMGLAQEAVKQAGRLPDLVYVTGGTAQAPIIRAALQEALGDVEIVSGNLFQGVVSGLSVWANQLYR
ncbi:MAG: molecular chaperone [Halomonas sp.]|uniref:molecular chaperone n=2 Tax=unclassified Halomonas TaxID=2609666 RepID=UPI003F919B09